MERKEDGYCGLFCGSCVIFMKTKEGKSEELALEMGMPVEDIACFGCKSDQVSTWCRTCYFKTCCREKGFDTCAECDDLMCENLTQFKNDELYPYHIEIGDYLNQIKNEGKDKWLASMHDRWSCKNCHTSHNWYQQKCDPCGSTLDGYKKPQN